MSKNVTIGGSIKFHFLGQGSAQEFIEEFGELLIEFVTLTNDCGKEFVLETVKVELEDLCEFNDDTGEDKIFIKK